MLLATLKNNRQLFNRLPESEGVRNSYHAGHKGIFFDTFIGMFGDSLEVVSDKNPILFGSPSEQRRIFRAFESVF